MLQTCVRASKNYPIIISDDLSAFSDLLKYLKGDKVAIVTDDIVGDLYGAALDDFLKEKSVYKFVIRHGEQSKNAENYIKILNGLAKNGFTRSDSVIALGGGVVGDLAAFIASTYMRGINLVQVPTTILSAVDSSVGGKTAINLDEGKNLCGTFYQPNAVYIDINFLSTLPEREIFCGYGEIIKYAFLSKNITEADLTGKISEDLVYKCLKIKADIVEADEKEGGARKLLNLGHTVGHAIERLSDFSLSHGECVVKGIFAVLGASKKYYGFSNEIYDSALKIISARGHDLSNPFTVDEIMEQIRCDKKSGSDFVDAVLIDSDLSAKVERISFEKFRELLE
ncbi:MAG: 3-dehydroquinate synthase [Clostridia bacterium]|nr:3-dehydroquinate synthase [Clostridia bacterium]